MYMSLHLVNKYTVANAGFAFPSIEPQQAEVTGNGTPGLLGRGSIPCSVLAYCCGNYMRSNIIFILQY